MFVIVNINEYMNIHIEMKIYITKTLCVYLNVISFESIKQNRNS